MLDYLIKIKCYIVTSMRLRDAQYNHSIYRRVHEEDLAEDMEDMSKELIDVQKALIAKKKDPNEDEQFVNMLAEFKRLGNIHSIRKSENRAITDMTIAKGLINDDITPSWAFFKK